MQSAAEEQPRDLAPAEREKFPSSEGLGYLQFQVEKLKKLLIKYYVPPERQTVDPENPLSHLTTVNKSIVRAIGQLNRLEEGSHDLLIRFLDGISPLKEAKEDPKSEIETQEKELLEIRKIIGYLKLTHGFVNRLTTYLQYGLHPDFSDEERALQKEFETTKKAIEILQQNLKKKYSQLIVYTAKESITPFRNKMEKEINDLTKPLMILLKKCPASSIKLKSDIKEAEEALKPASERLQIQMLATYINLVYFYFIENGMPNIEEARTWIPVVLKDLDTITEKSLELDVTVADNLHCIRLANFANELFAIAYEKYLTINLQQTSVEAKTETQPYRINADKLTKLTSKCDLYQSDVLMFMLHSGISQFLKQIKDGYNQKAKDIKEQFKNPKLMKLPEQKGDQESNEIILAHFIEKFYDHCLLTKQVKDKLPKNRTDQDYLNAFDRIVELKRIYEKLLTDEGLKFLKNIDALNRFWVPIKELIKQILELSEKLVFESSLDELTKRQKAFALLNHLYQILSIDMPIHGLPSIEFPEDEKKALKAILLRFVHLVSAEQAKTMESELDAQFNSNTIFTCTSLLKHNLWKTKEVDQEEKAAAPLPSAESAPKDKPRKKPKGKKAKPAVVEISEESDPINLELLAQRSLVLSQSIALDEVTARTIVNVKMKLLLQESEEAYHKRNTNRVLSIAYQRQNILLIEAPVSESKSEAVSEASAPHLEIDIAKQLSEMYLQAYFKIHSRGEKKLSTEALIKLYQDIILKAEQQPLSKSTLEWIIKAELEIIHFNLMEAEELTKIQVNVVDARGKSIINNKTKKRNAALAENLVKADGHLENLQKNMARLKTMIPKPTPDEETLFKHLDETFSFLIATHKDILGSNQNWLSDTYTLSVNEQKQAHAVIGQEEMKRRHAARKAKAKLDLSHSPSFFKGPPALIGSSSPASLSPASDSPVGAVSPASSASIERDDASLTVYGKKRIDLLEMLSSLNSLSEKLKTYSKVPVPAIVKPDNREKSRIPSVGPNGQFAIAPGAKARIEFLRQNRGKQIVFRGGSP